MTLDPLRLALLHTCAGTQPPEELPDLATDALVRGLDTPSLCELAGASPHEHADNRELFLAAVDELGWDVPDPQAAVRGLVRCWAEDISAGRLSPYEGAQRIWVEALSCLGQPDDLTGFMVLADAWEDVPEARARIEREIVEEARALLREG